MNANVNMHQTGRTIVEIPNKIVTSNDLVTGSKLPTKRRMGVINASIDAEWGIQVRTCKFQNRILKRRAYIPILIPAPKFPSA